ncbi:Hypothetical protein A7982_04110 [Minicystis rosea]|nr:Hypothetical protein A7982_04110 [Minicystis rosea]
MFQPNEPAADADESFEIDPMRAPYFMVQQVQPTGEWLEVGAVWTFGTSRTNTIEYWFLYETVSSGDRGRAAYTWPGYSEARGEGLRGTSLRLMPATPPDGLKPATLEAYFRERLGIAVTALKGTVGAYIP